MTSTARTVYWIPKVVNASDAHDHDWRSGLLMMLAAILALGWIDANDRAVSAAESRAAVEAQLAMERAAKRLPRVAWVIESSDPGVQMSLAEIAGALDVERAKMRGAK